MYSIKNSLLKFCGNILVPFLALVSTPPLDVLFELYSEASVLI